MLAPVNVSEKGTEMSVPVQDRNGCMESGQRFLHQLGDTHVLCQSGTARRKKREMEDERTHRHTRKVSSRVRSACGGEADVRRWPVHVPVE